MLFSRWVDEEWRLRNKRELSQGYVLSHAVSAWTSSKQSVSVSSLFSELPFGSFSYRKFGAFAFLNSVTSHALSWQREVNTGRSLCSIATSRHACPTRGLVPWPSTIHTVSVLANALSQVWTVLTHTELVSWYHLRECVSTGLLPKLILLEWGEHALGQHLLCALGWGGAPHPILFGLLSIISLHLQNAPMDFPRKWGRCLASLSAGTGWGEEGCTVGKHLNYELLSGWVILYWWPASSKSRLNYCNKVLIKKEIAVMLQKYFCAVFPPLLSGEPNYQAMHPRRDYAFTHLTVGVWLG